MRKRLICAYPIGSGVGPDSFKNNYIKPATFATQTGCYVVWHCADKSINTVEHIHSGFYERTNKTKLTDCHNPLTWNLNDDVEVSSSLHQGAFDASNK